MLNKLDALETCMEHQWTFGAIGGIARRQMFFCGRAEVNKVENAPNVAQGVSNFSLHRKAPSRLKVYLVKVRNLSTRRR